MWKVVRILALPLAIGVAACDSPTAPADAVSPEQQELVSAAYTMGLSTVPIQQAYTISVNGNLYDIGCPMQCWLPAGIVSLVQQMVDAGSLMIIYSSPPFVYVAGTRIPVFLQNGRPIPVCSNGIDDDGDGFADWPADPGCISATDNDETDPPPPPPTTVKLPPTVTAPTFVKGTIPFKGVQQPWYLNCPIRATLVSNDGRTWTPIGVELHMQYMKFTYGSGWVMQSEEVLSFLSDATVAGQVLAGTWQHTLAVPNHEGRFTMHVKVRGDDGEELLVPVNDGANLWCAL